MNGACEPKNSQLLRIRAGADFDNRLVLIYGIAVVAMSIAADQFALSVAVELIVIGGLVVCLAVASAWHRIALGWRWSCRGPTNWIFAAAIILFMIVFMVPNFTTFPPTDSRHLPWYLGVA